MWHTRDSDVLPFFLTLIYSYPSTNDSILQVSLFTLLTIGHGEGRLGRPSVKGSEVWCLRMLCSEVWNFFRATLPCLHCIGCVDRNPFGGALHTAKCNPGRWRSVLWLPWPGGSVYDSDLGGISLGNGTLYILRLLIPVWFDTTLQVLFSNIGWHLISFIQSRFIIAILGNYAYLLLHTFQH